MPSSRRFGLTLIAQVGPADYDVTTADLTALQTAIDTFKPMGTERDGVGDNRAAATGNIVMLLKECAQLLNMLDTLVMSLIKDQAFVALYLQTRKITDRTGRGKVKDDEVILAV